jgi:prefoldin subunit 5
MKNTKLKYKLNFKTMKKGLLTLLAASLVFVGCQNYDDQFDDLNAQISALKSQVDGLSALSGQVASLSGSISGLQSGIAASASSAQMTALSASLSALQAEVDAIEASIATTATAAEVTALQASLTALETDLADLLVSNNVYSTDITVNSAASMASALALGNKVALMNAAVTITDDATIADADIQTFIDRIKTMNGTFTYSSGSATGYAATFDELTAATVLDITQAGDISFKKLASATTITITTSYSTKITSFDMGALTTMTSIASGADGSETANTLTLSSATNVDLGAMTRYGAALTITTKKGATLDIASLDDVNAAGTQTDITLTLNGPGSVTMSKIDDGIIDLTNVATATVSGFYGELDINAGVETLTTTDSVRIDLDGATDLVTATLDFKNDWDPALTTAQAAVSAALYSTSYLEDYATSASIGGTDLKTLTVTGELLDLYLDEANLETLSIDATMTDLTISSATDLTSLTVASGSLIGSISLTGSNNLTVADFNHTSNMENKGSSTANTSVSFVVTDNLGLTKLHTTGDDVSTFTVTGNDALTELDMTGLKDQGGATSATVNLYDNDLTAVSASNTSDGETDKADGASGDAGSFDDGTSGMDTMKVYLTAIAADADNTVQVNFDTVSTETDTETTGTTTTTLNVLGTTSVSSTTNEATVLKMTPATANTADAAKSAIGQIYGMIITPATQGAGESGTAGTLQVTTNGVNLFDTSLTGNGTALALSGNQDLDIEAIKSSINLSRATSAGVTRDAKRGANSTAAITLREHGNGAAGAVIGERYTTATAAAAGTTSTNYGMGTDDYITITIGSNSVTATAVSATLLGAAVYTAWAAKYHGSSTASAAAIATMTSPSIGAAVQLQALAWTMNQEDSGGYGKTISVSVTAGTTTATSAANIDWTIGSTNATNNNTTVDDGVSTILTLTANDPLVAVPTVTTAVSAAASMAAIALSTTKTTNTDWNEGRTTVGAQEPITDVRNKEDAVAAATSNAVAAVSVSRVTWLG